jgi:hypothetical protein
MKRFFRPFALLLASALLAACRYSDIPQDTLAKRALPLAEAEGSPRVTATYFPVTHANAIRRVPVVVLEPRFFGSDVLHRGREGGLLAYLNFKGHPAWRITIETPTASSRALATPVAHAIRAISQASKEPAIDVLGASLGAPSLLHAVALLADEGASPVRRVVFLGAGLDYAYPGSFLEREHDHLGGLAGELCATEAACKKLVHHPESARPYLGRLPPTDADDAVPAAKRYTFLERRPEPVLFIAGKADGIAPSEASFPVFLKWGEALPGRAMTTKRFFLAARENALGDDYDHAELFLGERVESEVFAPIVAFLERD